MNTAVDYRALPNCTCTSDLNSIRQKIRSTFQDITNIMDLAEQLVAAYRSSSRCDKACSASAPYMQTLLECVSRLLDFFDATWLAINGDGTATPAVAAAGAPDHSRISQFQGYESPRSSQHPASIVSGHQAVASIDRFVLGDSERNMLLQEVLRGLIVSMNKIVEHVHDRASHMLSGIDRSPSVSSTYSTCDSFEDLCESLLERTYSALAHYEGIISDTVVRCI